VGRALADAGWEWRIEAPEPEREETLAARLEGIDDALTPSAPRARSLNDDDAFSENDSKASSREKASRRPTGERGGAEEAKASSPDGVRAHNAANGNGRLGHDLEAHAERLRADHADLAGGGS
jgi:hypothetical protein